ncbi:protein kinase family protein [Streptomyces sp. S.PB5]|nr:protein kinase family protein [Streptomyces sp. S.PB5]MDN3025750.1 protein kinase family protein [Streptomyces sp. S.PB5]
MPSSTRRTAHSDIARSLSLLGDHEIAGLLAAGTPLGTGIGGRAALVEVAGRQVFVKRVPLTDLERRPENVRSTANLFDAPPYLHYGIGAVPSPGFGAWRELAVHELTTDWVLTDAFAGFPLMHHWRILPDPGNLLPPQLADVEGAVAYWGGDPGLRRHIEALRTATASIALFLEYIPYTVHDWLRAQLAADRAEYACRLVEQGLEDVTSFLHGHELLHMDAHFGNILTDGHRLYLSDHGLSLTPRFRLAPPEREFFDRHRPYDRAYTSLYLVLWLVTELYGHRGDQRSAFLRACADGVRPEGIPEAAAGVIARHARTAAVMDGFSRRFQEESRLTAPPYDSWGQGAGMPASR